MKSLGVWVLLLFSGAIDAHAEVAVYSIHIGVNVAPDDSGLNQLQYADDDAGRFYSFFYPLARRSVLATVLDRDSQRMFSGLAKRSVIPTLSNINAMLGELANSMELDRKNGKRVVFYFSYSGHGIRDHGETFLTLIHGHIDRSWLESRVMSLPADVIHIFIDACHSQALVQPRGSIGREVSAISRTLNEFERTPVYKSGSIARFPNVGAMVAAATDTESHEWSRIRAGVFTYEVLSALAGAADVNLDGEVSYSEVAAFIASANRSVKDPRASLGVVYNPPGVDRNMPIVELSWFVNRSVIEGIPAGLGHFYMETDEGIRLLDAHPVKGRKLRMIVPAYKLIWVRNKDMEASFKSRPGVVVRFASLKYHRADTLSSRGSIADSFRKGFFATPFGKEYYLGFVDQTGEVGVSFDKVLTVDAAVSRQSKVPAVSCLIASSLTLGATALFSYLAWDAQRDFDATDFQRPAQEARDRLIRNQALAIGSAAVTVGFAIASWLLWPDEQVTVSSELGDNASFDLNFGFRF